jgi:hypothetical protein
MGEAAVVVVATEAVAAATVAEAGVTVEAAVGVAATVVAVEEVCFKKKLVTLNDTLLCHRFTDLLIKLNHSHCTKPPRMKHEDSIYARTLDP